MANAQILRGVDGRVSFGGTVVNLDEYSIHFTADDIPALGFEDVNADGNTYDDGATGVIGAEVTGKGYWNAAQNPHGSPPNIKVGQVVSTVNLYVSKAANRFYSFTQLRILSCSVRAPLRGRIDVDFSGKSNGKITYPV